MPLSAPALWETIRDWPLPFRAERDDAGPPKRACTRFEHNLRKIGDYTDEAAEEITAQYRRFLYLKAVSGAVLTPPEWLDQAWHLHLSLGDDLPGKLVPAIGRPIEHRTGLSRAEGVAGYARLLRLYVQEFDEMPDLRLWPDAAGLRRDLILRPVIHALGLLSAGLFAALVVLTGVNILWMGVTGEMLWQWENWFGPIFAAMLGCIGLAVLASLFGVRSPETIARCG